MRNTSYSRCGRAPHAPTKIIVDHVSGSTITVQQTDRLETQLHYGTLQRDCIPISMDTGTFLCLLNDVSCVQTDAMHMEEM